MQQQRQVAIVCEPDAKLCLSLNLLLARWKGANIRTLHMRNFSCYVSNRLGIHARPSAILATLHKHFFPNDDIMLISLSNGHEANLGSAISLMNAGIGFGSHVEFVTLLDELSFEDFRHIIFLLGHETERLHAYDLSIKYIAQWRGDRKALITGLSEMKDKTGITPIFSLNKSASQLSNKFPKLDFTFDKEVLEALHDFDPLAYEDAIKVCTHLSRQDATGLIILRRLCERIVNRLLAKTNIPTRQQEPLAVKVDKLSQANILQIIDLHCLTMFRFLGNAGVHDSGINDKELLPDQEAAFHILKLGEGLIRRVLVRLDDKIDSKMIVKNPISSISLGSIWPS
jgi:phosphotransferase system HPr (HPr) family protein